MHALLQTIYTTNEPYAQQAQLQVNSISVFLKERSFCLTHFISHDPKLFVLKNTIAHSCLLLLIGFPLWLLPSQRLLIAPYLRSRQLSYIK